MIPFYIPTPNFDFLMKVEDSNYFEIVGTTKASYGPNDVRTFYNVELKAKVLKNSSTKRLGDFNKIVVSIRRKPSSIAQSSVSLPPVALQDFQSVSNQTSIEVPRQINTQTLNSSFSANLPPLPTSLEKKLYSGLQIVQDSNRRQEIIASREMNLTVSQEELISFYQVPSLVRDNSTLLNSSSENYVEIDPTDLLKNINKEMTEITEPVSDQFYSGLSSPANIEVIENYATSVLHKRSKSLYSGIVKYYLDDVPRRSDEASIEKYKVVNAIKQLDTVEFSTTMKLNTSLKRENLEVVFELYRNGSSIPEETIVKDLNMKRHVEAFESIKIPPQVSYTSTFTGNFNSGFLNIVDMEERGKVSKFKVYSKNISPKGESSPYVLLEEVENSLGTAVISSVPSSNLSIIRVVPVNSSGDESNVFTNIAVGPGHSSVGNLSIVCKPTTSIPAAVEVTVHNIPRDTLQVILYKRSVDPSVPLSSQFSVHSFTDFSAQNTTGTAGSTAVFTDSFPSLYTEYYAQTISRTLEIISTEIVLVKCVGNTTNILGIDVKLSQLTRNAVGDNFTVSFNLETLVIPEENQRIIDIFKDTPALKEIYDSLISPSNTSRGAAAPRYEKPIYGSLYVHEIVRTDLNTGERSSFDLIGDGLFSDDENSRRKKNISPIKPQHAYVYQVFTYEKDPVSLFRGYVLPVVDSNAKTYYYIPYKWNNHEINAIRIMPSTDDEDLPVIDEHRNFTAKSLGERHRIKIEGSGAFASITRVSHNRIDRNTVKIDWDFDIPNYSRVYDSFVVLKVVNGRRKFVGRTKDNYIYHELSDQDVGRIYYTVVPITVEFDIDAPGHSDPYVLQPDGIIEPTITSQLPEDSLVQISTERPTSPIAPVALEPVSIVANVSRYGR